MSNRKDISGKQFGYLTALKISRIDGSKTYWECICKCGNKSVVRIGVLSYGGTKSCGCLNREKRTKHGLYSTPEYRSWWNMIRRCENPEDDKYPIYGGRGIKVCDEWKDISNFYRDMGEKPSSIHQIDRINNNDGYHKENCRWVTPSENCRNKSDSKIWVVNNSQYQTAYDAAKDCGVAVTTIFRWCKGYHTKALKKYVPPKNGCSVHDLYTNA